MAANTAIQSPADALNACLVRMGYKKRVGSLFDGSEAAQQALNVYAQCRDDVLRGFDYDFAMRSIALSLLKSAPVGGYFPPNAWNPATNPPMGFAFEYGFPADALKIRIVKPAALFPVNADPQFYAFTIANDNAFTPAQRVILSNVPSAIANYTGQVTDLSTWDVAAVEELIAALARRLAGALMGMEALKAAMADEQAELGPAMAEQR